MDIVYRAYDGKEFDSEEDCELYETVSTIPKEHLGFKLFDRYGEPMPLLNEDNLVYEDFYYIKTHSAEEAATLHDILCTVGYGSPWDNRGWAGNKFEAGCYYYDCEDSRWKNFKDFEDTYNHMLSIFNQGK